MGKKPHFEILQRSAKAYIICIFFFLMLNGLIGLLLCYGPLPEAWMEQSVLAALTASCFLIGLMAGSILQKRGLFYGIAYAAILLLLLLLAIFWASGSSDSIELFKAPYLICLFFGGIGGIMGINQKN